MPSIAKPVAVSGGYQRRRQFSQSDMSSLRPRPYQSTIGKGVPIAASKNIGKRLIPCLDTLGTFAYTIPSMPRYSKPASSRDAAPLQGTLGPTDPPYRRLQAAAQTRAVWNPTVSPYGG